MALARRSQALQVHVSIFKDGAHHDLWAVALDVVDQRLNAVVRQNRISEEDIVVSSGSLGSRAHFFSPAVINAIRSVDEANVQRHHFDVVHLRSQPDRQVVGIAKNAKLRRLAYLVALTCRDSLEMHMQRIISTDTVSVPGTSFSCPTFHNFPGIEFVVQYFAVHSDVNFPYVSSSDSEFAVTNQGVWASPMPTCPPSPMFTSAPSRLSHHPPHDPLQPPAEAPSPPPLSAEASSPFAITSTGRRASSNADAVTRTEVEAGQAEVPLISPRQEFRAPRCISRESDDGRCLHRQPRKLGPIAQQMRDNIVQGMNLSQAFAASSCSNALVRDYPGDSSSSSRHKARTRSRNKIS